MSVLLGERIVSNTWFERDERRYVTCVDKKRTPVVSMKCDGNTWEFLHTPVVDIGKKKIRNIVRNTCTERRKISFLNDLKIRNEI